MLTASETRLEQRKARPNVNVCAAEENLEEELYLDSTRSWFQFK